MLTHGNVKWTRHRIIQNVIHHPQSDYYTEQVDVYIPPQQGVSSGC